MKNKPRKLSIESVRKKRLRRESFEKFMPLYVPEKGRMLNIDQFEPIKIPIKNTCTAFFSTYTESTSTTTEKPLNFWQKLRVKITKFFCS